MTSPTSSTVQGSTPSAPGPKFKLKSPRSLSRLKAMRQSANLTKHTPQDQQRPPLPAADHLPASIPLGSLVTARVQGHMSSPIGPLPCHSSHDGEAPDADADPDMSTDSEHPTTPRLASLGAVRGAESSHSPQTSSSSTTGPSRSSVDTTTNESDPLTASSADSTPRTSPSSSHRDLRQSRAASAELWSGGSSTMDDQHGSQAHTPPRRSVNGRGHFSSPTGSAVRAMGRKLLRFRHSSANESSTAPLSVKGAEREGSINSWSGTSQGTSLHTTASTPRQRDFNLDGRDNAVGTPHIPPLGNLAPSAESRNDLPSDQILDEASSKHTPDAYFASDANWHLRDSAPGRARTSLSADGFELLDALDAVMKLGADEAQTMLSSTGSSTGSASASSAHRAFPTWPHATDDFAPPRLLTEAQMAQLEEEERSRKPRNIFSRFSLSGRFASSRQSRPNSTVSSVSEDDYGGDEDSTCSRQPGAASECEASTSIRRSHSNAETSRDARNSEDHQSPVVRSIVTPGPGPRLSAPGLHTPVKRALYSCTLLKMHPQLAHLMVVSLCRGWPTSDDRGRGPVEILYPRSVNSTARLRAASRRGGSQLGTAAVSITPGERDNTVQAGHKNVIRKLKFARLRREEEIEIGFFMKDYASHYISREVILRALAARPQVSPEALARPPGTQQGEHDGRASVSTLGSAAGRTSSQSRTEGTKHGLALWAARKPFLERCAMTRGDIGTTFDVGDIVVDPERAKTLPIVGARSPKPGRIRFSAQLRIQAGLAPASSVDEPPRTPLRRADRDTRDVRKMPPPWVAPRASVENLLLRANSQSNSPEQQPQLTSAQEVMQACEDSAKEATPTAPHVSQERDIDESTGDAAESKVKDAAHRRTCSQTSCSSTDESFQSAASSIHSSLDEQDEDDVPIADLFERRRSSLTKHGNCHSSSSSETVAALQSSSTSPPSSPLPRPIHSRAAPQAVAPHQNPSPQEPVASEVRKGKQTEGHLGIFSTNTEAQQKSTPKHALDAFKTSDARDRSSKGTSKRLSHQLPARAAGGHRSQGASIDSIYRAFMLSPAPASSSQRDPGGAYVDAHRTSDAARRHSHQPSPTRPSISRRAAYNEHRIVPAAPSAQLAQQVNNAALMRFGNASSRNMASGGTHGQLNRVHEPTTPPRSGRRASHDLPAMLSSSPFRSSSSSPSPGMGRDAHTQILGGARNRPHPSRGVQPHNGHLMQDNASTPEQSAGQQKRESRGGSVNR